MRISIGNIFVLPKYIFVYLHKCTKMYYRPEKTILYNVNLTVNIVNFVSQYILKVVGRC